MRVLVRSLSEPNTGSKNSASTLSNAITAPASTSFTLNVFFKINGIMPSYTCQNALIDIKARPTRMVRLLLSFILSSPLVRHSSPCGQCPLCHKILVLLYYFARTGSMTFLPVCTKACKNFTVLPVCCAGGVKFVTLACHNINAL
ncbi:hypothetical protein SDC9_129770 [bioreactor metagenome]|uniref:Uncharacterized protein n=1 Tax=bioreactor metagenome TaxID=1076179 RepID=A0A645D0R8_9ZZZZ